MKPLTLVLTCEHGGNRVPRAYVDLFSSARAKQALTSHRGADLGALALAEALEHRFGIALTHSTVTRLLVDLNRSIGHRALFSEFSRALDADARKALLEAYYFPYRDLVRRRLADTIAGGVSVVHVSVHSFVARLSGVTRNADIGLLYDSRRRRERAFCERWQSELEDDSPDLRVRRNYPYRGAADGLTTALRRELAAEDYIGIELEANQSLLTRDAAARRRLESSLATTLARVLS
jgi:predicted N-formylglutamate amidohydrolase